MADRRRSSSRSGGGTGCVVWLILLCVVLLLFLANMGKIRETLERTNFTEIMKTERGKGRAAPGEPEPAAPAAPPASSKPAPAEEPEAGTQVEAPEATPAETPASGKTAAEKPAAAKPEAAKGGGTPSGAAAKPEASKPADAKPEAARTRNATLYFVRIDEDGVIARLEVKRQIPATDSPLSDAMAALLKGPIEEELRRNLLSLVPQGTVLLSAQVRGSTAFLNFNEAFMYNRYGIEGYAGQLKQVVYTATSFPTVQDVQVLIEGKKRDYLGGEGVYIGRPLSRNSF
jgi:spore germination protein GerM